MAMAMINIRRILAVSLAWAGLVSSSSSEAAGGSVDVSELLHHFEVEKQALREELAAAHAARVRVLQDREFAATQAPGEIQLLLSENRALREALQGGRTTAILWTLACCAAACWLTFYFGTQARTGGRRPQEQGAAHVPSPVETNSMATTLFSLRDKLASVLLADETKRLREDMGRLSAESEEKLESQISGLREALGRVWDELQTAQEGLESQKLQTGGELQALRESHASHVAGVRDELSRLGAQSSEWLGPKLELDRLTSESEERLTSQLTRELGKLRAETEEKLEVKGRLSAESQELLEWQVDELREALGRVRDELHTAQEGLESQKLQTDSELGRLQATQESHASDLAGLCDELRAESLKWLKGLERLRSQLRAETEERLKVLVKGLRMKRIFPTSESTSPSAEAKDEDEDGQQAAQPSKMPISMSSPSTPTPTPTPSSASNSISKAEAEVEAEAEAVPAQQAKAAKAKEVYVKVKQAERPSQPSQRPGPQRPVQVLHVRSRSSSWPARLQGRIRGRAGGGGLRKSEGLPFQKPWKPSPEASTSTLGTAFILELMEEWMTTR